MSRLNIRDFGHMGTDTWSFQRLANKNQLKYQKDVCGWHALEASFFKINLILFIAPPQILPPPHKNAKMPS